MILFHSSTFTSGALVRQVRQRHGEFGELVGENAIKEIGEPAERLYFFVTLVGDFHS